MNRHHLCSVLALAVTLLVPCVGQAEDSCQAFEGTVDEMGEFDKALKKLLESSKKQAIERANTGLEQAAEVRPSSVQVSAPSASGSGSGSLVDGASAPAFIGMAFDSGVIESGEDGKLTLNLNAFAVKTLFRPTSWTDQAEYEKNALLRRFSATVALGGKGEKFDRDGDGEADDPLEAKALDDVITWEARVRLTKSRDRRERYNWRTFYDSTAEPFADVASIEAAVVNRLGEMPDYAALRAKKDGQPMRCVEPKAYQAFFEKPDVSADLEDLVGQIAFHQTALDKAWQAAADEVSRRFVLSFVAGGVERKTDFGPDKEYYALRGDGSFGKDNTFKLNAEWNRMDSLMEGADDPETTKIGLEASTLWFKGSELFGSESLVAKNGVEVALAASWEQFENVPTAAHESIWKASARLEIPVMDGLKLPISVTYADHIDVLTDQDEVIGHIGLSWDLSKLLKMKKESGTPSSGGG